LLAPGFSRGERAARNLASRLRAGFSERLQTWLAIQEAFFIKPMQQSHPLKQMGYRQ
jgi:hypothetical protein